MVVLTNMFRNRARRISSTAALLFHVPRHDTCCRERWRQGNAPTFAKNNYKCLKCVVARTHTRLHALEICFCSQGVVFLMASAAIDIILPYLVPYNIGTSPSFFGDRWAQGPTAAGVKHVSVVGSGGGSSVTKNSPSEIKNSHSEKQLLTN